MFSGPSLRIGRVFGIPVEVNASWLLIFALVSFSLATSYFPSLPQAAAAPTWLMIAVACVTSLLFFGSVLAHEMSHAIVTKLEGGSVDKITLFLFGGVAQIEEEPRTPGREFLMAASGPGMSLVISAVCWLGFYASYMNLMPWWLWAPLQYLAIINLALGLFNLLPGFPLDGGRVLRSILWAITGNVDTATKWASRSGQFIGWFMMAWAVVGVLNGRIDLIWFGLVGWFISALAGQAYRQQLLKSQLDGVTVNDVMSPAPEYVDGNLRLDELVQQHFLGSRHSRYPVMSDGMIVGLVTLPDVKSVAQTDWPYVTTLEVTNRELAELTVPAEASVESLLSRLAGDKPGALLVIGDHRLVGIVTRADIITALDRRELG